MYDVVTVFENEDFKTQVEVKDDRLFLHTEVENFNKQVMKTMREVFEKMRGEAWVWGWDHLYSYTQNVKFCDMIHECEVVGEFTEDGETYEVVAWESKPQ